MNEPFELYNMAGCTAIVDARTDFRKLEISRGDEHPNKAIGFNIETSAPTMRKVTIFCAVLLTLLVISSATLGVLINLLMLRADAMEKKSVELQAKIDKLQNRPEALTEESYLTSLDTVQTKLRIIESRLDASMASTDASFQNYTSILLKLENNGSSHTSMILDQGSKIEQLEIKTAANNDTIQNHGTKISKIETDSTANLEFYHQLNKTLEQLAMDISFNEEEIHIHQTRLNETLQTQLQEIESRLEASSASTDASFKNYTSILSKLENNDSSHTSTILDQGSRIEQLEIKTAANNDTLQNHDTKISKIEADRTTNLEFYHQLNITLEQLAMDISADKEEIHIHQTRLNATVQSQLLEIEQRLEASTASTEASFQNYTSNLLKLENNGSSRTAMILDQGSRIEQLGIKAAAINDTLQNHSTKISKIETDSTTNLEYYHQLNNTLELLAIEISTNEEKIHLQQTRLNEIEMAIKPDQDNIIYHI